MTRIVTTHYRYKRPPRKRKAVALQVPAIVRAADPAKARKPQLDRSVAPTGPVEEASNAPTLPANDDRKPAIVTAKHPRRRHGRFGNVPDMTPEEHKRHGDAAVALWRELVRRVREE